MYSTRTTSPDPGQSKYALPHLTKVEFAKVEFDSKKKLHASQAETDRVQLLRQQYREEMRDIRAEDLVFIDETGVNLMMVWLYARALKGERAAGERPYKKGTNVTLIGAMSLISIQLRTVGRKSKSFYDQSLHVLAKR